MNVWCEYPEGALFIPILEVGNGAPKVSVRFQIFQMHLAISIFLSAGKGSGTSKKGNDFTHPLYGQNKPFFSVEIFLAMINPSPSPSPPSLFSLSKSQITHNHVIHAQSPPVFPPP